MDYAVKLEAFEGPLDLLLHLIKKNTIDIYNIPISLITTQYFDYLETMRVLNLDVAGEYLVLAASLVHIKSKLLLPAEDNAEAELENDEDPRQELVEQLLEYQKYKTAAERLAENGILERDIFVRNVVTVDFAEQPEGEEGFKEVSVFDLISVFQDLLKSVKEEEIMEFVGDKFSLIDKVNELVGVLKSNKDTSFEELLGREITKRNIVRTFLALLELIKRRLAKVYQANSFGMIRILSLVEE